MMMSAIAPPYAQNNGLPKPGVPAADRPFEKNLNIHVICKDCKEFPPNLVEEFSSGDIVCGSCGLVLGDRTIDTRSEWRTFSNDDQGNDDPSRVGDSANPLLNGNQLDTGISFSDGGSGRARDLHRAQNKVTHDKSTKSLLAAYKEIGAFCDSTNLQKNVADTAKQLYKSVDDAKAFKGKPQEVIIAGCIFIACRKCNVPRTFREIFAITKVPKKEIGRVFKALEKFFSQQGEATVAEIVSGGGIANENAGYTSTTSTKAHDLMIRFCNNLGLTHNLIYISQELAERAAQKGTLAGRSPISSAAACIYMISHLMRQPKTAKEISAVAGVSDGTIKTAYKLLYNEHVALVDQKWIEGGKGDTALLPSS
ncbi:transcription initiation factor IIB [Orbilia blumenaviensis]|uniref:Transcription initiation factor IIB n=1 Tax=Orbilia blumenaviensis TaxID=1796055 RepID=A0AAV9UWN7_9PEZI